MRRFLAVFILASASYCSVRGDGGVVIGRGESGDLRATVVAHPMPASVGAIDISVFAQNTQTLEPLSDLSVLIEAAPVDVADVDRNWTALCNTLNGYGTTAVAKTSPSNRLMQSARLGLPGPGRWEIRVRVTAPDANLLVACPLQVSAGAPAVIAWWPAVFVVPVGLLLYFLRARLLEKRVRRRQPD